MSLNSPAPVSVNMHRFFLSRLGVGSVIPRRLIALDLSERVIIGVLFGNFAYTMLRSFLINANIYTLLIVISESLPLFFVILRTPSTTLSRRPSDWIIGISAAFAPLLARPDTGIATSTALLNAALILMVIGFLLQIAAKVAIGTRFGLIAANRGVCVIGPYRLIRHPMYAGYIVTHIGFLIANPSAFNTSLYTLTLILQLVRINREERVLRMDPSYLAFAKRVPYRLFPGVY